MGSVIPYKQVPTAGGSLSHVLHAGHAGFLLGKAGQSAYNQSGSGGGPAGPGDGGSMIEARVGRLEEDVKEIKADLKSVDSRLRGVEVSIAVVSEKVSNLPGWPGLLAVAGLIIGAVGLMLRFMPAGTP